MRHKRKETGIKQEPSLETIQVLMTVIRKERQRVIKVWYHQLFELQWDQDAMQSPDQMCLDFWEDTENNRSREKVLWSVLGMV